MLSSPPPQTPPPSAAVACSWLPRQTINILYRPVPPPAGPITRRPTAAGKIETCLPSQTQPSVSPIRRLSATNQNSSNPWSKAAGGRAMRSTALHHCGTLPRQLLAFRKIQTTKKNRLRQIVPPKNRSAILRLLKTQPLTPRQRLHQKRQMGLSKR